MDWENSIPYYISKDRKKGIIYTPVYRDGDINTSAVLIFTKNDVNKNPDLAIVNRSHVELALADPENHARINTIDELSAFNYFDGTIFNRGEQSLFRMPDNSENWNHDPFNESGENCNCELTDVEVEEEEDEENGGETEEDPDGTNTNEDPDDTHESPDDVVGGNSSGGGNEGGGEGEGEGQSGPGFNNGPANTGGTFGSWTTIYSDDGDDDDDDDDSGENDAPDGPVIQYFHAKSTPYYTINCSDSNYANPFNLL